MGRKGEGEERLERLKNKGLGILDSRSRWTRGGKYRLDESISRVRSRSPRANAKSCPRDPGDRL